jgi:SAM-dependent methyltransferase
VLTQRVRGWLLDPEIEVATDIDSTEHALATRRVLERKLLAQKLFERFYRQCRSFDLRYFGSARGRCLEIGSGSSKLKEVFPDVIASDVLPLPWLDLALSAGEIPFADRSLRAIYGINVFHHLPDPRRFFREAIRVLDPGGGVVLIEPYHGPLARLLFAHLHSAEAFDPDARTWESEEPGAPISGANQALSFIVFTRDRERFLREFPELELVADHPHTHVWYLASGGVNFRQLVPDGWLRLLKGTERVLSPFDRWISLQHTIVLRKALLKPS